MYMIPNQERADERTQEKLVTLINELGYEPLGKPIHRYTWDDVRYLYELYEEAIA